MFLISEWGYNKIIKNIFLQVTADAEDPIKCPKVIVFLPMLLSLFSVCRQGGCGASVAPGNIHLGYKGGCLNVTATCDSHHQTKWSSSPSLGIGKYAVPIINILIGTYAFLTGLHVEQVCSIKGVP